MTLSTAAQQCVGWVESVYGDLVSKGPADAFQYADPTQAGSLASTGWTQVSAGAAKVGDIVVLQPGAQGVSSAGHIISIAAINGTGNSVLYTQANVAGNEGAGSPPTFGTLSSSALASKGVSVWAAPAAAVAQASTDAQAAAGYLLQQGVPLPSGASSARFSVGASANAAQGTSGSPSTSGSSTGSTITGGCQSLRSLIGEDPLTGIPIVGGVFSALTAPEAFLAWIAQPCVWWKVGLGLGAVALLLVGGHMLVKGRPAAPVTAGRALTTAAKGAALG